MNKVYLFIIGVLVVFVLLQNKGCVGGGERPTSDTLIVHDIQNRCRLRLSMTVYSLQVKLSI
jgi:hypothetical protein